jgi:hypothetical protein
MCAAFGAQPPADAARGTVCPACNAITWTSSDASVQFATDRALRLVQGFQLTVHVRQCVLTLGGKKVTVNNMPLAMLLTPNPLVHIGGGRFSFTRLNNTPPMPETRWHMTGTISGTGVVGTRATGALSWTVIPTVRGTCTPSSGSVPWSAHETGYASVDALPPSGVAGNAGGG